MPLPILEKFHPVVRSWFQQTFGEPSPPQRLGWPSISEGNHTLIVAPTGSGKTLAAFLWCINHLTEENLSLPVPDDTDNDVNIRKKKGRIVTAKKPHGVRILYISPLKALNNDIHRNLEIPLKGITQEAHHQGLAMEPIRSAVRTGDTTATERNRMLKHPPDILITTPESLYLMLTSEKSRSMFSTVRYVIIDEIHAVCSNKRGVHLSLSLERLEHLIEKSGPHRNDNGSTQSDGGPETPSQSFVRIGLSATQKPLEEVAHFLGGLTHDRGIFTYRPVSIIDAGYKKETDLQVICAPHDFTSMVMDNVWHSIYPRLLHEISGHATTLIFVNNRRLAERLSAKLNALMEGDTDSYGLYSVPFSSGAATKQKSKTPFTVHAYHGSMSRTVRERLETELKKGSLRALVTTSALELGIDIGNIDLVIQIQSPKGVARGLQRVGRSGHLVSAKSKGRIFATHREDLVESAVVAKGMNDHAIERTSIPKNCLDVLAQQIVAMVGVENWNVDDLFDRIRCSYCYGTLTEPIFHTVLEMLAGRYTTEAFRQLRGRIVWDKIHNSLTTLPGSSLLAITNAGTIPDKGYYGVYLEDQKTKIGEVDEEFIYESRTGDTFILGTSVWRMMDIDANKVVVQPAPGQPARMPFWRGEMIGRTYELSIALGEFVESVVTQDSEGSFVTQYPVDEHSVRNITGYILEQQTSTDHVPSHRTIVVEGFRDEIGDPRIVVHSRFGKGINALLGIVLHHQLQQRLGIDIQLLYNDDGILFRCSDVERLPLDLFSHFDFNAAERIILEHLPTSPLFGALFRQNAERALLLPKGRPGMRRPFFLQRLKAADLLQIVRQYNDFPIVIETMRECLTDVLDFGHFKEVMSRIEQGEIRIHTVQNESPSPFASSLLFDFTMVYMYEWDDPKQVNKEQLTQLNRELLSEVVDLDNARTVVRHDAITAVEEQLQFTSATRRARSAAEMLEILLRLGELTEQELSDRTGSIAYINDLRSRGLLCHIMIGEQQFTVALEELPLYRSLATVSDALIAALPEEIRNVRFEPDESLRFIIARMLRSRGPVTTQLIAERYNLPADRIEKILTDLSAKDDFIRGNLTQESAEIQWCYRPNMERIHRASISLRRKEITPATSTDFTKFLLRWQHRHSQTSVHGDDGLQAIVEQMQGYALPAELWEAEILRTRLSHYHSATVRTAASRGEFVSVGSNAGRSLWIIRGEGNAFLDPTAFQPSDDLPLPSRKIFDFIVAHGASFLSDIREALNLSLPAINRALSELFWRGLVTNDQFDEVMNIKRYRSSEGEQFPDERFEVVNPRRNPFRATAMRGVRRAFKEVPGWNGRWSLVGTKNILGPALTDEERIRRQAEQLLIRYGIVAREIAKREENFLPWPLLAMEMQRMEMRGELRRGYFVEGLSGMQFALPEAVGMLEEMKHDSSDDDVPAVVSMCDPANPYGAGVEWTTVHNESLKISRIPGNFAVFDRGVPVMWIENYGARIYTSQTVGPENGTASVEIAVRRFIDHLRSSYPHRTEIVTEYCNSFRPSESGLSDLLRSAGFYRDRVQTMRLDLR
ncbi:MAG: DEAD/DEAH box helicase [Bacteroidota bacterium]